MREDKGDRGEITGDIGQSRSAWERTTSMSSRCTASGVGSRAAARSELVAPGKG